MAEDKNGFNAKALLIIGAVGLWIVGAYLINQGKPGFLGQPEPTPTPLPSPTSTPMPMPTPFLQEYESEDLGVKLSYPQNWLLEESNNLMQITNYNPENAPGRGYVPEVDGDLFKVEMYLDTEYSDVEEWLTNKLNEPDPITGEPLEITNRNDISIDGNNGIFYETESPMTGLKLGNVHIETPDKGILHIYGQLNYPDHTEDFTEIYQSVEFIE